MQAVSRGCAIGPNVQPRGGPLRVRRDGLPLRAAVCNRHGLVASAYLDLEERKMATELEDGAVGMEETCALLETKRPASPLQETYFSYYHAHLDRLWGAELSEAMAAEARQRWATATLPQTGPRTPVSMDRATGKRTPVAVGPLLERLHDALLPLARALSARLLVPTFAAYGYYRGDDRVVLHVDGEPSDVVLLAPALGDVGSLHLHPELVGMTPIELGRLESDPGWDRLGGLPVNYPVEGVTALRGNVVPHHRPGLPIAGLCAVAALHYRSLF